MINHQPSINHPFLSGSHHFRTNPCVNLCLVMGTIWLNTPRKKETENIMEWIKNQWRVWSSGSRSEVQAPMYSMFSEMQQNPKQPALIKRFAAYHGKQKEHMAVDMPCNLHSTMEDTVCLQDWILLGFGIRLPRLFVSCPLLLPISRRIADQLC